MADAESTNTGWPVLRETIADRNILIYLLSLSAASTGIWAARIAIAWLAWELTQSGIWLGVIASAALAPAVILAPIGGAIADKIGPIRALQLTQIGQLILSTIIFILAATQILTIHLLLAYVLASSVVASLGWSSSGGILRALASDRNLLAAVVWNNIVAGIARIVGPGLGGIVMAKAGAEYVFLGSILGYLVFLFGLHKIALVNGWGLNYAEDGNSVGTSLRHATEYFGKKREIAYLIAFLAICVVGIDKFPFKELIVQDMGSPKSVGTAFVGGVISFAYLIVLASRGSLSILLRLLGPCFLASTLAIFILSLPLHNVAILAVVGILGAGITILSIIVWVLAFTLMPPRILFTGMGVYHLVFTLVPALFVFVLSVSVPHETIYLRWVVAAIALLLIALWFWLRKRVPVITDALNAATSAGAR